MAQASRWLPPRSDAQAEERLRRTLGISGPAARVLVHRGYSEPAAAAAFLDAPLSGLHDPFLMRDMDKAVDRMMQAIQAGEQILLYGDYDVDGTSSIVILAKALELAGAGARFHVPHRLRDGYGMKAEVVEQAAVSGTRLVLSVDTGIRAAEVVRRAAQLGIDVIVTDHHLPEANLPPALAVLNPNRPDCTYPYKGLCGAGVAFKLVTALLERLGWTQAKRSKVLSSFLKMTAIATVADVVPLDGENRIIVKNGLAGLAELRNPGLQELFRVAGVKEGAAPTARQVAFQIAPRINAAGRMDSADGVVELFLTTDRQRAAEIARQLNSLNLERQQTEGDILDRILEEILLSPVDDSQAALVFAGPDWHRGVVGIVASRVVERHHRPVFVLDAGEDGLASGSGRSIPQFHLLEAIEAMSDLFVKFGGHRQAAGVTLESSRIGEFRRRLNAYAAERLTAEDFRPTLQIDAQVALDEIDGDVAGHLLAMEPFGFGNPPPVLAAFRVELRDPPAPLGEKHLRLRVWRQGRPLDLKAWNFAGRAGELRAGCLLDVAFTIDDDAWSAARGYAPWTAALKDARVSPS